MLKKIVVIGLPGETGLYLVDLDAGTVVAFEVPANGTLASANEIRKAGGSVVKDVDFAVAIGAAEAAFSGVFDG